MCDRTRTARERDTFERVRTTYGLSCHSAEPRPNRFLASQHPPLAGRTAAYAARKTISVLSIAPLREPVLQP